MLAFHHIGAASAVAWLRLRAEYDLRTRDIHAFISVTAMLQARNYGIKEDIYLSQKKKNTESLETGR